MKLLESKGSLKYNLTFKNEIDKLERYFDVILSMYIFGFISVQKQTKIVGISS